VVLSLVATEVSSVPRFRFPQVLAILRPCWFPGTVKSERGWPQTVSSIQVRRKGREARRKITDPQLRSWRRGHYAIVGYVAPS
jgi:hypothetical protein